MYKILIISDSNKHFDSAINEYKKRLGKNIELLKIKPVKNGTDNQIIEKETKLLISKLDKMKGFKIILNPVGDSLNTRDFYTFIENKKHISSDIIFIIGGANGLDYSLLKSYVDCSLSLGKITMPHSLALLVIIEQIYRLEMIKKGTSYNK